MGKWAMGGPASSTLSQMSRTFWVSLLFDNRFAPANQGMTTTTPWCVCVRARVCVCTIHRCDACGWVTK
jgi:hypothetical protein